MKLFLWILGWSVILFVAVFGLGIVLSLYLEPKILRHVARIVGGISFWIWLAGTIGLVVFYVTRPTPGQAPPPPGT